MSTVFYVTILVHPGLDPGLDHRFDPGLVPRLDPRLDSLSALPF